MRISSIAGFICIVLASFAINIGLGSSKAQARQCIQIELVTNALVPTGAVGVEVDWFKADDVTFTADYAARLVDVKATKPPFRTVSLREDNLYCNPDASSSAVALVRARDGGIVATVVGVMTAGSVAALGTVCPACGIVASAVEPFAESVGGTSTASDVTFDVRAEDDWIYVGIPSDDYVTTVLIVDVVVKKVNVVKSDKTPPVAIAYSDCNFMGKEAHLQIGPIDDTGLKNLGIANDTMSSISVSPGYSINLFRNAHFQGQSVTMSGQQSCFDSEWNDRVSSAIVIPGG